MSHDEYNIKNDLQGILNHNRLISERKKKIMDEYSILEKSKIAPCKFCRKDGFACDGCESTNFSNFAE